MCLPFVEGDSGASTDELPTKYFGEIETVNSRVFALLVEVAFDNKLPGARQGESIVERRFAECLGFYFNIDFRGT